MFFKFQSNLVLTYTSTVSCICNILVKLSAAAELQSFKGHFTGQKLNINMDSLTVYQLTMKFD